LRRHVERTVGLPADALGDVERAAAASRQQDDELVAAVAPEVVYAAPRAARSRVRSSGCGVVPLRVVDRFRLSGRPSARLRARIAQRCPNRRRRIAKPRVLYAR